MPSKAFRLKARRVDVEKAIALHRAGRLDAARLAYEQILLVEPRNASALHFLGVLHHQLGKSDAAIAAIRNAIAIDPGYADAHNNLGNILRETNQFDAALAAYQRVVQLAPAHADGWNNLGVMLRGQGRYDEAEQAYARALELDPSNAAAWHNRGSLLARLDQFDVAVAAYRRVLDLRPRDVAAYDALCRTLYRAGRVDEAIEAYHEWLAVDPENPVARHMLTACTGEQPPERASDRYVRDTFDGFAGNFDQVLDQLGYRAPGVIGEWLDRVLPGRDASLIVADAGCGTGLCAQFLRPRAKRLVGVDLSPGMLAKARARAQYDELVEAELSAWLVGQPQQYDLIVSADTLCYFGALDTPLAAAANALRPGGHLAFTVENAGETVPAYHLDPTGRYSHAEPYVRQTLAEVGLECVEIRHEVLRRERGHQVNGLLVSARRSITQPRQ